MKKNIKITQIRSVINRNAIQKATMKALGLKKIRHYVYVSPNKSIIGMLNNIIHLVKIEIIK
ncbi:MAG: 50S ribosomal protein L30 [Bacteroides sp.]|nr:MAG: 50S ribosomal protein L30 [Bacteroides sp.]